MSRPDIPVTISGDEKGFRAAMARVKGVAGSTANDVTGAFARIKSAAGVLPSFFAAAGITTAVTALRNAAGSIAAVGDEAKRAGLSLKAFQELKFVAEQNRIGVDQLTDGIKELNLRADEFVTTGGGSAAEAFKRLGLNADELKGKLKEPSVLFAEIIGRLGQLDKAAQIRVSDEIFGGAAGERFVELISQGEAGIRKTIKAANDLGLVMSDELVAKAAEVDRQFNVVSVTVSTKLKGAIVSAYTVLAGFVDMLNAVDARQSSTLEMQLADKKAMLLKTEKSSVARFVVDGAHGQGIKQLREEITELERLVVARKKASDQETAERAAPKTGRLKSPKDILREALLDAQLKDRLSDKPGASERTTKGGARSAEADKEAEAIKRVVEALQGEIEVIGLSAVEREKLQALREAGVTAASKEGQQISALVEQKHRELAAEEALIDARERAQEAAENFGAVLDDQLDRIIAVTFEAKDALAALAKELANAVTGGKGLFSGLASMLFGGGSLASDSFVPNTTLGDVLGFGGPRAAGGSVSPGRLYEVNEREQEFFVPKVHGDVIPASKRGGDPVNVTYAPVYNFTGTADEIVKIKQQAAQDRADFEGRTIVAVRKAQQRRILK
ncbi:tail tape measure protein [Shinella sp. M31]|uniref:tail tape measure protein n=1 Tax=Shinella sp. M31 TaxID=3368615 RepID=UPI003B9E3F3E